MQVELKKALSQRQLMMAMGVVSHSRVSEPPPPALGRLHPAVLPPPPPPPRNASDVTASIVTMVLTVLLVCRGRRLGLFSLAFLVTARRRRANIDGAVTASMTTVVIAGLVAFAGIVATIVRLVVRKGSGRSPSGRWVFASVSSSWAMAFTAAVS